MNAILSKPVAFIVMSMKGQKPVEKEVVVTEGFELKTAGPHNEVTVKFGQTINLGNYTTARIDVGLVVKCDPGDESVIYEKAKAWIEGRMQDEVNELRPPSDEEK